MAGTKKIEKDRKKVLTNGGGFGILSKLSLSSLLRGPAEKRDRKISKKQLTNGGRCGKLKKLPRTSENVFFKNFSKKYLTKRKACGKLKKLLLR